MRLSARYNDLTVIIPCEREEIYCLTVIFELGWRSVQWFWNENIRSLLRGGMVQ